MKQPCKVFVCFPVVLVALLMIGLGNRAVTGPTSFTSDDFNSFNLKRPQWTFTDPNGDAVLALTGTGTANAALSLTVPGGSSHDLWTNGYGVPRILETSTNTDFNLEVKWLSPMTGNPPTSYVAQGILVEADASNLVRFDLTSEDQDSMKVFAASFAGGFGSPTVRINKKIGKYGTAPLWMRVNRTGNTWTVSYSFDGTSFNTAGSFSHTLTVTKVGVFAGNAGNNPAPHTAVFDYFFNTDAANPAEDGSIAPDTRGPLVHNVHVVPAPNALLVSWNTDEQSSGEVQYGETTSYGNSEFDFGLSYSHSVTLPNLTTSTTYNFRVLGTDNGSRTDSSGNFTGTTTNYSTDLTTSSDDFNAASLNTGLWTLTNPRGDATVTQTANQLSMSIPGGVTHDLWIGGNFATRIMQPASNGNFQIVAKFNSGVSNNPGSVSIQGIVVEADSNNLIRFDLSNSGTGTFAFAAAFVNGFNSPDSKITAEIGAFNAAPVYLRVSRSGAFWILEYSFNGTTWTSAGSFFHAITVTKVGLFVGNAGTSPAAFTSLVDFFRATLPAKPLLTSPVAGAVNVPLTPTLTWDTTAAATTYRLQASTDSLFGTSIFNDSTLTLTSKQLTGLLNNTKYFWRVRGKNSSGVGSFSNVSGFTTVVPAPAAPALLSPANNATAQDTISTLTWTKPATTASFRLQVSSDSTFATALKVNDSTLVDTFKVVGGLSLNTRYFWRVNAKNAGGTSAFSTVRNFTTITGIPSVPVLLSPANDATNQQTSLALTWSKSTPPASSFHLQVATDPNFVTGVAVDDSAIVDTNKAIGGLANNTKYYWRVNAKSAGGTSPYSAARNFTTVVANPAVPNLVSPFNGATNQPVNPTFRWTRPVNTTSFRLQVGTDSTFATGLVFNDSTITDTSKAVSGLVFNARYFWRVNAKNLGGTGPYSSVYSFRTFVADPNIPVQLTPANGATNQATGLTLRWTNPAGATSYHLQVGTDSTFAGGLIVNDPALVDSFKVLNGLTFLTKYFWRVNADNIGGTSPYSPVWNFTVGVPLPDQVILVSPASPTTIAGDTAKAVWRKSQPLVNKYWFDLAVDSLFNFRVVDSTLTDTTKVARTLQPNTTYYWRVRAGNAAGWGPYSVTRNFRIIPTNVNLANVLPKEYSLGQNFPNPFNPSTQIAFALPKESHVTLAVYNLIGELVATLVDDTRPAGNYSVQFAASEFASGLYFYRLSTNEVSFVKKMMLVK